MRKINSQDQLFHDGNPATGTLGTIVTAAWLNAMQGELANIVEAAGLELDANDNAQVLTAILALATGAAPRSIAADANMLPTDAIVLVDTSAGPVQFTALSAAAIGPGVVTVKNRGGGDLTLLPYPGQTINGLLDGLVSQADGEVIRLVRQSPTNWETL